MSRNQGWFWTPDRLRLLCRVLDRAARRDAKGLYLGVSLRPYVADEGKRVGLHVDMGNAGLGLNILVFLGVLEHVGRKRAGYRRRLLPFRDGRDY